MRYSTDTHGLTFYDARRIISEGGGMPLKDILACCREGDPSAILLSDQCHMSIRLLVRGEAPRHWRGCIMRQFSDAMAAIDESNPQVVLKWRSEFTNVFPRSAVHEVLANAVIHCDAYSGRFIDVVIGAEYMIIRSPGRSNLRPGGGMAPRNGALAAAMASMGWATLKARGMMAILDAYRRTWSTPRAEDCGNGFQVTLPALSPQCKDMAAVMDRVLEVLRANPGLTAEEVSRGLFVSLPAIRTAISQLEATGRIFHMGQEDCIRYYSCEASISGAWQDTKPMLTSKKCCRQRRLIND